MRTSLRIVLPAVLALGLGACGNDEVSSDEQARRAYLGLDKAIEKSLQLGFAGYNAASSANIPDQSTTGDAAGTLLISGQVDQGSSANKGMRLRVGMVGYSDGEITLEGEDPVTVTYDTVEDRAAQPALNLSLRNIPTGTFSGTLVGRFQMQGDLVGGVNLNLTFAGEIEDNGEGGTRRKPGTTTVTGTAANESEGVYQVNLTL
jgi:hypothetical protein